MKKAYFLSILSGILLFLSFPKFGSGAVAWVSLIPLILAIKDKPPKMAFSMGLLAGLISNFGIFYWMSWVMHTYGGLHWAINIPILSLLVVYLGLYLGLFTWVLSRPVFMGALNQVIIGPALWVTLEYIRAFALSGFPWELLGYSQYRHIYIIQVSDIAGIYGISFLIVMVNVWIKEIIPLISSKLKAQSSKPEAQSPKPEAQSSKSNIRSPKSEQKKSAIRNPQSEIRNPKSAIYKMVIVSLAVILLITLVMAYGYRRVSTVPDEVSEWRPLRVVLVQGNIDQAVKWDKKYRQRTIDIYKGLSKKALEEGSDLLVWPETALPFHFTYNHKLRNDLRKWIRDEGISFVFGAPHVERNKGEWDHFNSAFSLSREGNIIGRYDKVHLVPFGEYAPLGDILPLERFFTSIGSFQAGSELMPIQVDIPLKAGILICYEVIFPVISRRMVKNGAGLLINITNDAWFGRTSAPHQHLSMAVFRAVENRTYMVRSANTGITAVIDPLGRIISRSGLFTTTYLNEKVFVGSKPTPYQKWGDAFVYLCMGILGVYLLYWYIK